MKKICRVLKLHKYRGLVSKETQSNLDNHEFMVLFEDHTFKHCISKFEVYSYLERDHIKPILYIFDMYDRIIVSRDILIDTDHI